MLIYYYFISKSIIAIQCCVGFCHTTYYSTQRYFFLDVFLLIMYLKIYIANVIYLGEGNGSPLLCSCWENPRDREAWWAAISGVAQSRTWLKQLSSSSSSGKLLHSCSILCNPMDSSLPGSSVHGILQARILEWVALPSSRGSSRTSDWTHVSYASCIGRWVLCY